MPNLFSTRIFGNTWRASGGLFELYMRPTVPYLEKTCPDMAERFGLDYYYYVSGMGFSTSNMTLEEEKHVLEALKAVYREKKHEMSQIPKGLWDGDFLEKTLPYFQELIDMLEEEIRDIERGKLIVQEDGKAIVNENFIEDSQEL